VQRDIDIPNVLITVKNLETLDEYQLRTYVDLDFLPKIQKWISLKKYHIDETVRDLRLYI
jgi:hypothetical protein